MNENAKAGQPIREPQVESEVCKLDKSVALVETLVCHIIERLDPVALPRNPEKEDMSEDRSEECPQLVQLAMRLHGVDRRVNTVADMMQCLLDRIEL